MTSEASRGRSRVGGTAEELEKLLRESIHYTSGLMGVAIGKHVGLFDVMSKFDQPATSHQIAQAGRYKERYVQEWLAYMAAFGIVVLDIDGKRFSLPTNHRRVLTGNNSILPSQACCMAGCLQSFFRVAACFNEDGPAGIDGDNEGLNEGIGVCNGQIYTWQFLHKRFLPQVPGLLDQLERGIEVVEIGSHEGGVIIQLAEHFSNSRFLATDVQNEPLEAGKKRAMDKNLANIDFKECDIYQVTEDMKNRFDYMLMIEVLHDLPYINKALKIMVSMVRPGGFISIVDVEGSSDLSKSVQEPEATELYFYSVFRCLPLSMNFPGSDGAGGVWGREATRNAIQAVELDIVKEDQAPDQKRHYICQRKQEPK